jgi:plasmid replication initiation protein
MNTENQNLKVYKANKIVEASYALHSLHEQLLVLACLGIADPKTLTAATQVRLTVERFADIADLDPRYAYDDLRRAADRLFERWLMIDAPDPENPKASKTKTRWVQSVTYEDGGGAVTVMFAHKIIPYLTQLERCFTSYNLRQVAGFNSFYSHRIYELLVQFPQNRERTVTVEWLRENFALKDTYPRIVDLKKWVIDTAIKDINEYTDLAVSYTQRKRGKTIEAFVFQYGPKPKPETQPNPKPKTAPRWKTLASVAPGVQPPDFVRPPAPAARTPEQLAKAREFLEEAKKMAAKGK